MAEQSRTDKILDPELTAWLERGGEGTHEMIVEAKVPARTVHLTQGPSGHHGPSEIGTEGEGVRAAVLRELRDDLNGLLGDGTNLLHAANAIVVRANRAQLLEIAKHRLVKAVRSNRRLKSGSVT
jgi:hypothetical protein